MVEGVVIDDLLPQKFQSFYKFFGNFYFFIIINSKTMDISDFQGLYKYKLVLPVSLIAVAVLTILSVFIQIPLYFNFCCYLSIYAFFKAAQWNCSFLISYMSASKLIKKYEAKQMGVEDEKISFMPPKPLMYSFVIPNYQQDMDVLENTLNMLKQHPRAKQKYCIFLAMQAKEQNSNLKATKLMKEYKSSFRFMHATYHQIRVNQLPGKASNVSWCVESLEPVFQQNNIETQNMFFTIIDADTLCHRWYIEEVEEQILTNYDQRFKLFCLPSQLYFYNDQQCHVLVRTMDHFHSYGHIGQFYNMFNTCMPLSNYTLSYNLIKKMGYWDTCADAIGEDFHTCSKAQVKTNGQVIMKKIHVSMNQMNIKTGNGTKADVLARLWQGVRHVEGSATFAYVLKDFFQKPNKLSKVGLLLFYLDFCLSGILFPWTITNLIIQDVILSEFFDAPPHPFSIKFFIIGALILNEMGTILYNAYRHLVIEKIHKQKSNGLRTMIEMKLYFFAINYIYIMPIMFLGLINTLRKKRQYVRADKKIEKNNEINLEKQRAISVSI